MGKADGFEEVVVVVVAVAGVTVFVRFPPYRKCLQSIMQNYYIILQTVDCCVCWSRI